MHQTLQYAHQREARPWRPILFLPSVRSWIALCLTIGCAFWLHRRHQPWIKIWEAQQAPAGVADYSSIPSMWSAVASPQIWFSSQNRLLVQYADRSLRSYDSLGQSTEIWPGHLENSSRQQYFVLPNHDLVMIAEANAPDALVIDVNQNKTVAHVSNLTLHGYTITGATDDLSRVIATRRDVDNRPPAIFDLRGSAGNLMLQPLMQASKDVSEMQFTPDKHFIVMGNSLLRADDLTTVRVFPKLSSQIWWRQIVGTFEVQLVSPQPRNYRAPQASSVTGSIEVRDLQSGRLIANLPCSWRDHAYSFDLMVSDDQTHLALSEVYSHGECSLAEFWDLQRKISLGRDDTAWSYLSIVPGSHDCLAADARYSSNYVITTAPGCQPLAVIPGDHGVAVFSPDAQYFAILYEKIEVFRRTGRECRESTLGILGMPHTWLLLIAGIGLFISLCLDARRLRVSALPWSQALGLIFLAAGGIVVSLFMLLKFCLLQPLLTPAPLLLVVVIGLGINSRFWRLISILIFSATCIWIIDQLRRLHFSGDSFNGSGLHWILDRRYDIPNGLLADILLASCAICLLMLLSLLLKPRPSAAASAISA